MKHRAKFEKSGALAIAPNALSMVFDVEDAPKPFDLIGSIAVIEVVGPLTHHAEWCWDNYDSIKARAVAAFESSSSSAVVLKLSSPGGMVSGCFETVRALRDLSAKSGKKLVAYADGVAASAAYALATAAGEIYLSSTSLVGSVGVVAALCDVTAMNKNLGVRIEVIASGAKKAIGNPDVAIDEAAIAETRGLVEALAEMFFAAVAESRPSLTVDALRALEAGVFLGDAAVAVGLADQVCTFDELLAKVASGSAPRGATAAAEDEMDWKKARQAAADEGDEEAKQSIAAEDGGESDEDQKKKDEEAAAAAAAEGGEDGGAGEGDEDQKKKDEEAKASASAIQRVGMLEREVATLKANSEKEERDTLLAARTDLTAGQVKLLRAQPLEQMRRTLAAFPASAPPVALTGVRGKAPTQGSLRTSASDLRVATNLSPHAAMMDRQMGLSKPEDAIAMEGDKLVCRTMTPTQAREHLKKMAARDAAQEAVK